MEKEKLTKTQRTALEKKAAKRKKVLLALAGVLGAVVALLLALQIRLVPLRGAEKQIVYRPLFGYRMGGSAGGHLHAQLARVYGAEGVEIEQRRGKLDGKDVVICDVTQYEFEYLGRAFDGFDYALCTATTTREARDAQSGAVLHTTTRVCTYRGYDDIQLDSQLVAEVIWDTLEESYSESREIFDGLGVLPEEE